MDNSIDLLKTIAQKDAEIARLEALVKYYEEALLLSKSRSFTPKSEKKGYIQFSVFSGEENAEDEQQPEPATELETITYTRKT